MKNLFLTNKTNKTITQTRLGLVPEQVGDLSTSEFQEKYNSEPTELNVELYDMEYGWGDNYMEEKVNQGYELV